MTGLFAMKISSFDQVAEIFQIASDPAPMNLEPSILRNFKNATFYVDCFLYWVDVMLFPIQ